MTKKDRLKGIVLSMPTPTKDNYELDLPKLKEHINWIIDEGMVEGKAVLMAGSGLGAAYFLTREEHMAVMKTLVDTVNGRVPTMTGIFDSCTKEAVAKAKYAQDIGIDFLQVNTPHYLAPTDDEAFMHYQWINDGSECGIVAYNTPWASMNFEIKPALLDRMLELDNFVGLKWASNDPVNLIMVLKNYSKKVNIIDNTDLTTEAFHLGAKGYISLFGNIAPKAELYLLNLLETKQYEKFDEECGRLTAWRKVLGSAEELSFQGVGEGSITSAMFEAIGKPIGPPMPPQRRVSKESVDLIRDVLKKNNVLEMLNGVS
jgi:dihydrodipicolinate synthase/N-acetylneuraminate lyase